MANAPGVRLRCLLVLFRQDAVLLVARSRAGQQTWVLPGGEPEPGEGSASCARRETREEAGLVVDVVRCAFVLETIDPDCVQRTLEIVFLGSDGSAGQAPVGREAGLHPQFIPLSALHTLDLLPPLAGHLRHLHAHPWRETAPYLGNLWRPDRRGSPDRDAC